MSTEQSRRTANDLFEELFSRLGSLEDLVENFRYTHPQIAPETIDRIYQEIKLINGIAIDIDDMSPAKRETQ